MGEKSESSEKVFETILAALRSCLYEQEEVKERLMSVNSRLQGLELLKTEDGGTKNKEARTVLEKFDIVINEFKANNQALYGQVFKLENVI